MSRSARFWLFVRRGPLVGMLVHLALFVSSLLHFGSGEYMGVKDDALIGRILGMFTTDILLLQAQLLGVQLAVGAVAGGIALALVLCWCVAYRRGRPPLARWQSFIRVVAIVLAVHFWFVARTLVEYPQVFYDAFYGANAAWRFLQILLTDHTSPRGFDVVAGAIGVFCLALVVVACRRSGALGRLWESRHLRVASASGGLLLGVLAGWLLASQEPPVTRNNILVIAVDSMRPDIVSDAAAFPRLSQIANDSARFDNAYSVMARTFPSWVSMLTGQYPHTHGIRHMFPSPENLGQSRDSVIAALRAKGYRTAVISDFAGDIFSRIELGFEEVRVPRFTLWSNVALGGLKLHYHLLPYILTALGGSRSFPLLKLWERTTDPRALTDEVWRWILAGDGRPFALVVFYSTAHFPYAAPYPWYASETDPTYEGPSRYHKAAWVDSSSAPGEEEQQQAMALYRGALRATDHAIGDLVDRLVGAGLYDTTSLLVTADHGENLYEDGFGIGHGDHLSGSLSTRIPLYIKPAGGLAAGPRVVTNTVRSIDVGPTMAALGGLSLPTAEGTSLVGLANGKVRASDPPVFFETGLWFINPEAAVLVDRTLPFMQGFGAFTVEPTSKEIYLDPALEDDFLVAKHRAVLLDGWKLMYVPTRRAARWELYHPEVDALEQDEVASENPEVVERLKPILRAWIAKDPNVRELGDWFVARDVR